MNSYSIIIIVLCILCVKSVCVIEATGIETKGNNPVMLDIWLKRGNSKRFKFSETETVRFSQDETIIFSCTTKDVHVWDGDIDHGKFQVAIKPIQRNSNGYFSSNLLLKFQKLSTENFSFSLPQNFMKCIELGMEKKKRMEKCIYIDEQDEMKSKSSTSEKDQDKIFFANVDKCPEITSESENGFSRNDLSKGADVPQWLWNAENNSVVCQVENPSRMLTLQSISCDNLSLCNLRKYCTIQTCPSLVLPVSPCESSCRSQTIEVNQVSGQVICEANGFQTQLNFITDLNHKTCFFKPSELVSDCNILELDIPDFDIPDGFPVNFSGRASKFLIIKKPQVQIILKNGNVMNPDVHVVSELSHQKNFPHFTFTVTTTATLDMEYVKVDGYRYDTDKPVSITKQISVKVGEPPKLEGLPSELEIPSNLITLVAFRTLGSPEPKILMSFNNTALSQPDGRFTIRVFSKEHGYLKIFPKNGNFTGVLEISASNKFGTYNSTIIITEMWQLTNVQSSVIALILSILILFIPYRLINFMFPEFPERDRERRTVEYD